MMDVQFMWFDDTANRPISQKIARAAHRYLAKYGQPAGVCLVNPATLAGGDVEDGGVIEDVNGNLITVMLLKGMLPDNFWLGTLEIKPNGKKKATGL